MPMSIQRSHSIRSLVTLLLPVGILAACGGRDDTSGARPEDVDQGTSIAVTDAERAHFTAPADSVLTDGQVTAYLKTSLLQFDLIRKESEHLNARVQEMEKREKEGGTLGQLRNVVDAGRTMAQAGDLVGGSYIRSARTLGYNPAEMEWVRERMGEVAGVLMMKPMQEQALRSAADMRAQAEEMRRQAASGVSTGYSEQNVDQMLATAKQMEESARANTGPRSAGANLEVLHHARPGVSDAMWGAVGFAGGASGLMALGGLSDPKDVEAKKKLDEFRRVYQDALANRTSPGMENAKPQP
ncbi:MAG: hypothetical protein JO040_10815 [Gemmatimonadetes bacterium]|nr:hypothetical protein [Gemmatimonadota bacterium]